MDTVKLMHYATEYVHEHERNQVLERALIDEIMRSGELAYMIHNGTIRPIDQLLHTGGTIYAQCGDDVVMICFCADGCIRALTDTPAADIATIKEMNRKHIEDYR